MIGQCHLAEAGTESGVHLQLLAESVSLVSLAVLAQPGGELDLTRHEA